MTKPADNDSLTAPGSLREKLGVPVYGLGGAGAAWVLADFIAAQDARRKTIAIIGNGGPQSSSLKRTRTSQ